MKASITASRTLAGAAALLALTGPAAQAKPASTRSAVVQALTDCRAVTDDTARLACYDKAAGAFDLAETKGEVVVIDRAAAQKVRREAFGFTLPSLSIFTHGPKEAPIDKLSLEIDHTYTNRDGHWVIVSTDGATWEQTESVDLQTRPRKGEMLSISKGILGAYFCNVRGETLGKCRRVS